MHPALAIPEILLHIFADLEGPTAWQNLARCAQVCTGFRGPAMELLWNGSTPLPFYAVLNLFPRDLIPIAPGLKGFIRRPYPRDWSETILRSPKIRQLFHSEATTHPQVMKHIEERSILYPGRQLQFFPRPQLPQTFFQCLAFYSPVPLQHIFSNLKHLEWTSSDLYCCLPFISDSIERLTLCSEAYELGFFQELQARMPSKRLEEIRFTSRAVTDAGDQMGLDSVDDLRSFLIGYNQLRRVILDRHFATGEVITVLGTLERVEYLEIIGTLYEQTLETSMGLAGFPALQELSITLNSRNIPFFQDPQNITSRMFSTFKVIYNGNSAAHLRDLFAIIATRWPQLRSLHINPPIGFYEFIKKDTKMMDLYEKPERISRIARSFITEEIIKPLLDLTLLEELVIEWPYPARLDNRVLKDMVTFWPNLRCLYLTPIPFVILPERPFIHFEDLTLFDRSRSLEKLAMFCDATYPRPTHSGMGDMSRLNISTVDPSQCTSLRSFDPGYSWINHPHVVVSRFKQIFPNASLPRWIIEDRRSRWGEVARRVWSTL